MSHPTPMKCPTNILEAVSVEHTDEEGCCLHCEVYAAHAYDCPSQHARILLGLPLLKTLIERQYEDILRQQRYSRWRQEHPQEAAENDAICGALLRSWGNELEFQRENLWSLLSSADDGPRKIVWEEE